MPRFEYKVLPAPKKPGKVKGVRGTDNKFAAELSRVMNALGAEGWEYQRTDTLPVEERQGLTGKVTTFQNMLVFRLEIEAASSGSAELPTPAQFAAPAPVESEAAASAASVKPESEPEQESGVASPAQAIEAAEAKDTTAAPVLSFRGGSMLRPDPQPSATAQAPRFSAVKEAPEGNAPAVGGAKPDNFVAQ